MFLNVCKQTFHVSHVPKSKRYFNVKSSTYYFHMKTKILTDFQICISVPLRRGLPALIIWTRWKPGSKYLKELLLSWKKLLSYITMKTNYTWCTKYQENCATSAQSRDIFKTTSKMEFLTKIANGWDIQFRFLPWFGKSLWWNLLKT